MKTFSSHMQIFIKNKNMTEGTQIKITAFETFNNHINDIVYV